MINSMLALILLGSLLCMIYALLELCLTIQREKEMNIPCTLNDKNIEHGNNQITSVGIRTTEFFV